MSGRIVNVRPKPGFLMDGGGEIIPARQNVVSFFGSDGLTNIMSGKGTTVDRRVYDFYTFTPLDPVQAEAAYREDWLVRKIIDIPPFDMTREWRDWQAEGDVIEKLEAEEKRLQLKAKCQRALVLSRLFGGSALILGTKDANPEEELNVEAVAKGGLTYVHVMSRYQLTEGTERRDPADPWFGQPENFTINTTDGKQVKLHPSRVVPFIGQRAPEGSMITGASWFWGDPIMQSIGQAVRNATLAQDGFAALIDEAKLDILKIPDLTAMASTPEYEGRLGRRLSAAKMGQSVWRAKILDKEEEWAQFQVTWAGMPEIMESFLNAVAGAADIPLTRLLGVSPKGLQSTGDGEERDYQAMVRARQNELLCPALDRIDELLIPSALGSKPSDVYYEFAPLAQMDEKDAATIEKQRADTFKVYADSGLIPDIALSEIAKNSMIESGRFPGSEKAFEDAEAAIAADPSLDPLNQPDETLVPPLEQQPPAKQPDPTKVALVTKMRKAGTIKPKDAAMLLLADASPRTLYVSRKLLNADALIKWAKAQGFKTTVPVDEMHVTVLYSKTAVDWMKMGSGWDQDAEGKLKVPPGGARLVEALGGDGAVVLLFSSSPLSWRHEDMVRNGASHDFEDYQPHVTITYDGDGVDLATVEPYRGELVFGPEIFAEIVDDWQETLTEE
jgi:phage-related protein (TIGR01555 family)